MLFFMIMIRVIRQLETVVDTFTTYQIIVCM